MRAFRLSLLLFSIAACAQQVAAQTVYKIRNPDGSVTYTDRKPREGEGAEVTTIKVRADSQRMSDLRIDRVGRAREAVAINFLYGPIEVTLEFKDAVNVGSAPPLPLRQVLPNVGHHRLAEISALDERGDSRFGLAMTAVPGDPAALPDANVYLLPVDTGQWRIDQGFNGKFSHQEAESRYAIDINVEEGTPILAARDGTVMQVEEHFEGAGLDREKFGSRANHLRIVHPDGSMAVYAHLAADGVLVRPGVRVRRGQRLGASGNTGFSTGPHLHFALQVNRGMKLEAIAFEMESPAGRVAIPGQQ